MIGEGEHERAGASRPVPPDGRRLRERLGESRAEGIRRVRQRLQAQSAEVLPVVAGDDTQLSAHHRRLTAASPRIGRQRPPRDSTDEVLRRHAEDHRHRPLGRPRRAPVRGHRRVTPAQPQESAVAAAGAPASPPRCPHQADRRPAHRPGPRVPTSSASPPGARTPETAAPNPTGLLVRAVSQGGAAEKPHLDQLISSVRRTGCSNGTAQPRRRRRRAPPTRTSEGLRVPQLVVPPAERRAASTRCGLLSCRNQQWQAASAPHAPPPHNMFQARWPAARPRRWPAGPGRTRRRCLWERSRVMGPTKPGMPSRASDPALKGVRPMGTSSLAPTTDHGRPLDTHQTFANPLGA